MITYSISNVFNYADISFVIFLAIIFLLGILKGLRHNLYGLGTFVLVIICAGMLSGITAEPVLRTDTGQKMYQSVDEWSDSWGTAFNSNLHFNDDELMIIPDGKSEPQSLESSAQNVISGKILTYASKFLVSKETVQSIDNITLADILVPNICYQIVWLAFFLIFTIVIRIFFALFDNSWDKATYGGIKFKVSNRILGGVVGAVYALTTVFLILAIFNALSDKSFLAESIKHIQNSKIMSWFYNNNPISKIFKTII